MAKRGGFPGGGMPGNMANLMKQAQKMQRQMCIRDRKKVLSLKLDEEAVDPDDVEMLEDLIVAALNEALEKVDAESSSAMSKLTGGMGGGMPGLF